MSSSSLIADTVRNSLFKLSTREGPGPSKFDPIWFDDAFGLDHDPHAALLDLNDVPYRKAAAVKAAAVKAAAVKAVDIAKKNKRHDDNDRRTERDAKYGLDLARGVEVRMVKAPLPAPPPLPPLSSKELTALDVLDKQRVSKNKKSRAHTELLRQEDNKLEPPPPRLKPEPKLHLMMQPCKKQQQPLGGGPMRVSKARSAIVGRRATTSCSRVAVAAGLW